MSTLARMSPSTPSISISTSAREEVQANKVTAASAASARRRARDPSCGSLWAGGIGEFFHADASTRGIEAPFPHAHTAGRLDGHDRRAAGAVVSIDDERRRQQALAFGRQAGGRQVLVTRRFAICEHAL